MTPNEIYDSFIIKANENAQTDNIAVDRARFMYLYNEASIKFIEWVADKKNEDDIRYLRPVTKTEVISKIEGNTIHQLAALPGDFCDLGNVNAKATSNCCKRVDIELFEIKLDYENTILNSEDDNPQ